MVEALTSPITQIQMFSKKFYFHLSYNHLRILQNHSLHLRKLQSSKPFPTSTNHDRLILVKAKTTRKKNEKRRIRRKEGRRGIEKGTGLGAFQATSPPPLQAFPSLAPSMGRTREQHNPHKGGTTAKQRNQVSTHDRRTDVT